MNGNGYQQYKAQTQTYKTQTVMTMTPGEMLLVLYDELTKRLIKADAALRRENYEDFDAAVTRCVDIVQYLQYTLNYDYPISWELNRMYDFFLYELSRLSAGRKREIIDDLKPFVKDLRDSFAEASKKNA